MPVKNKNRQSNSGYEGVITGLNDEEKKVLEDAGIGGGDVVNLDKYFDFGTLTIKTEYQDEFNSLYEEGKRYGIGSLEGKIFPITFWKDNYNTLFFNAFLNEGFLTNVMWKIENEELTMLTPGCISVVPFSDLKPNGIQGINTMYTIGNGLEIKDAALDIKSNVVKLNTYSINIDKTETSIVNTNTISFTESAKIKMTALFNLLEQNENNIFNIKVRLNLVDGTSFLIFMDYHKESAINGENIQGVVLRGIEQIDTHIFSVNDYLSNTDLQTYYSYLSSVDIILNYY